MLRSVYLSSQSPFLTIPEHLDLNLIQLSGTAGSFSCSHADRHFIIPNNCCVLRLIHHIIICPSCLKIKNIGLSEYFGAQVARRRARCAVLRFVPDAGFAVRAPGFFEMLFQFPLEDIRFGQIYDNIECSPTYAFKLETDEALDTIPYGQYSCS